MRKILFALVVVSLLAFGLRTEGEGATKKFTDCINEVSLWVETPGNVYVYVMVGTNALWLLPDGMTLGQGVPLTYAEAAALEPMLASLRAGAAARVKAKVQWEDSTKRVKGITVRFGDRC